MYKEDESALPKLQSLLAIVERLISFSKALLQVRRGLAANLTSGIELMGLCAIVAGVYAIFWPAALIVGGALAVAWSYLLAETRGEQ